MIMLELTVNGQKHTLEIDPGTPLLWALRDHLHLRGTKYGCGIGLCGCCTVHVDGRAVRSCMLTVADLGDSAVTTIEGLSPEREPVQQAWRELQVSQCGYCQPGMIMASIALLREQPSPTAADIEATITNICRCGTYNRVREAILAAARKGVKSGA
jgi:isoquinoline 1-oxidoreductase alpha subunit